MAAAPPKLQKPKVATNGTRAAPSKGRLVIALNSKPRDYVPKSGPPAPRVTLLPPEDSTAYIMNRFLLPSKRLAEDGKPLPKRMIYIIGWHDLPAAKTMVPVMKVLDYVSPAALERWESEREAELDLEREREELEEELALEKEPEATAKEAHSIEQQPTKKRKRGRPPTKMRMEPTDIDTGHDAKNSLKGGALALSTTPKKGLMKEFEVLLDDRDTSPSRLPGRLILGMDNPSDSQSGPEIMDVGYDEDRFYDAEEEMQTDPPTEALGAQPLEDSRPTSVSDDLGTWDQPVSHTRQTEVEDSSSSFGKSRPDDVSSEDNPGSWKTFGARRQRVGQTTKPMFSHFSSNDVSSRSSPMPAPRVEQSTASATKAKHQPGKKTTPEKGKKKRSIPATQAPAPQTKDDKDREWVVERIEDHNDYEVEGQGIVRYFKVLWEGDWPADQNPSWEPEENLPPKMVRNYFKRGKKKLKPLKPKEKTTTPKGALRQSTLSWAKAKRYSNVSEAFAGEDENEKAFSDDGYDRLDEDIPGQGMSSDANTPIEGFGQDDEVFVVDDNPSVMSTPRFDWGGTGNRLPFLGT